MVLAFVTFVSTVQFHVLILHAFTSSPPKSLHKGIGLNCSEHIELFVADAFYLEFSKINMGFHLVFSVDLALDEGAFSKRDAYLEFITILDAC